MPPPLPTNAAATLAPQALGHTLSLGQHFFLINGADCFPLQAAERWAKAVQLVVTEAARVVEVTQATGAGSLGVAEAVGVGVQITAAVRVHV